jgi:hypothetical protein
VSVRGRDLDKGKVKIPWEKRDVIYAFDDGWTIEIVTTPADLETEGSLMGHCGKQHALWVSKGVEYLFSLRNEHGASKATLHCKPVRYHNKPQPEDKELGYRGRYSGRFGTIHEPTGLMCGVSSTYYDGIEPETQQQFDYEGERLYIISSGVSRYRDESGKRSKLDRVKEWLISLGVDPEDLEHWAGGEVRPRPPEGKEYGPYGELRNKAPEGSEYSDYTHKLREVAPPGKKWVPRKKKDPWGYEYYTGEEDLVDDPDYVPEDEDNEIEDDEDAIRAREEEKRRRKAEGKKRAKELAAKKKAVAV